MWDKKRSYTKHNWKKSGVLLSEQFKTYDELYDHYLSINNCQECDVSFDTCKRYLDHDHRTGLFRNVLCNGCNRRRAIDNKNNYMGIKYISMISVTKNDKPADVYRIQFVRKGFKFFKQIRTNKTTLEDVIKLRNEKLLEIDGNLDSINQ